MPCTPSPANNVRRTAGSVAIDWCHMAQLFPRWADLGARGLLAAAAVLLVGTPLLLLAWVRSPQITGEGRAPTQPVPFDHRHHVADDGIDCMYCHTEVARSPVAGVPATSVCLNCHSQIWSQSPLLEIVWRSDRESRPIPWARVYRLPKFVFFNHAIHVRKGVGCESCHGRVDTMARVRQAVPLTMGWCLDCHRHPERYLRPRSDITTMDYHPARPQAIVGAELMREYDVHALTNCTTCHR
jgi:hypothetical protein